MLRFFKSRKPFAAFIIAIICSPVGGMLYLGKGWRAVFYFLAFNLFGAAAFIAWLDGDTSLSLINILRLAAWPLTLIGALHCLLLARKGNMNISKWFARWYFVILLSLIAPICLGLTVRTFFIRAFTIPSSSMEPSLNRGDYFIVQEYNFKNRLKRGDIIAFKHQSGGTKLYFVKRIIGMAGDKLSYHDGNFTVNGVPLIRNQSHDDIYNEVSRDGISYEILNEHNSALPDKDYIVPANSYFVVGDNRHNSLDSRFDSFGSIPAGEITGKVIFNLYKNPAGKLTYKKL